MFQKRRWKNMLDSTTSRAGDRVSISPKSQDEFEARRVRIAKWLFVFFITIACSGWSYLKCFVLADYWFAGTGIENFEGALFAFPLIICWFPIVFHIHVLRKEGIYFPRETWLISQS